MGSLKTWENLTKTSGAWAPRSKTTGGGSSLAFPWLSLRRASQTLASLNCLKLQTGPRAIAMAESFAGIADDVNAIQYNPSGLAYLGEKQLTLMHAVWFQDIFYDHLAVAWPIQDVGTIGLSGLYLNAGTFD